MPFFEGAEWTYQLDLHTETGRQPSAGRWENLPTWQGCCKHYEIQVKTEKIGYINAIFESFDNVARVQTKENTRGILEITVPEEWDEVFHGVVRQLAREIDLTMISESGGRK